MSRRGRFRQAGDLRPGELYVFADAVRQVSEVHPASYQRIVITSHDADGHLERHWFSPQDRVAVPDE